MRIVISEYMQARQTHRSSHAVAILAQAFERVVIADRQIHFSTGNQVMEIARRNVKALDRVRKRWENRMPRNIARHSRVKRGPPAHQSSPLVRFASHRV